VVLADPAPACARVLGSPAPDPRQLRPARVVHPFQRLIAQITLEAIADLGFALGGGQVLHAHGPGDRLSLNLDFYVTRFDHDLFDRAEAATLPALRGSTTMAVEPSAATCSAC
jgi:hypothetical protein